jgi:hypothetical protein
MSETFFNKPPENPDKDTFYTMGGLDNFANPPPENPDNFPIIFYLSQNLGIITQKHSL